MTEAELINLVEKVRRERHEGQGVELKSANKGTPERLYDTLSSFSNQVGGGVIIFGINEKAGYEICGVYDPQDLMAKVVAQCNQMVPVVRPIFTATGIEGKLVVSAEIGECDDSLKPCFYGGKGRIRGSYVRVGDADEVMSEYEVYSYEAFRRKIRAELDLVEDTLVNALDESALERYFNRIRERKKNLANLQREQILELQGFLRGNVPTLAGVLLFGLYPQAAFPQLCITAVRVPGTEIGDADDFGARFTDNKRIEGTIFQMLLDAVSFVRTNMRVETIINPETAARADRTEYPLIAVRELILNALVHRDYGRFTQNAPIRIMMFENRIEVESPGVLYGRLTIDELGKVRTDTRNPVIAGAMEIFGMTENRFSGIPTVRRALAEAGMPEPEFRIDRGGNFIATIWKFRRPNSAPAFPKNISESSGKKDFGASVMCESSDGTFYGYADAEKVTYYVDPSAPDGVSRTPPAKRKSPAVPPSAPALSVSAPSENVEKSAEKPEIPQALEVPPIPPILQTPPMPAASPNPPRTILDFCAVVPRSRAEISQFLGVVSLAYMQKTYLNPLIESGKLRMTLPEKPRSGKQRFYSEKGE